jgi:hypothetical protein
MGGSGVVSSDQSVGELSEATDFLRRDGEGELIVRCRRSVGIRSVSAIDGERIAMLLPSVVMETAVPLAVMIAAATIDSAGSRCSTRRSCGGITVNAEAVIMLVAIPLGSVRAATSVDHTNTALGAGLLNH